MIYSGANSHFLTDHILRDLAQIHEISFLYAPVERGISNVRIPET